ncbi:hypothetical protein CYMTET_52470 [Cymbomonas tetramitiformis]|uniref:Uncharacterized protein n=1 Tax=Cymbomonas tetramitiformis TaxID=36881 RepID=A0AAE0ERA9_9CHLO|nr:hypothetical protein CYMTET_52470 [Cymbomonas tetramitiformis]
MVMFEHVDGCKCCQNLYSHFQLPNGRQAHYYVPAPEMENSEKVVLPELLGRPTTLGSLNQTKLPKMDILERLSQGMHAGFRPMLQPVPDGAPLPDSHTVAVNFPDDTSRESFGKLTMYNHAFLVHVGVVYKEEIDVKPPPPKKPRNWSLPTSIYRPRQLQCNERSFFSTETGRRKQFDYDWEQAKKSGIEHLLAYEQSRAINRGSAEKYNENKNNVANEIKEIKTCLKNNYKGITLVYNFYAVLMDFSLEMSTEEFITFSTECGILDEGIKFLDTKHLEEMFNFADMEMKIKSGALKQTAEMKEQAKIAADINASLAINQSITTQLKRFEFMEVIVRLAIAKYGRSKGYDDLSNMVDELFKTHVKPVDEETEMPSGLPLEAFLEPDQFREQRLYCVESDDALQTHISMLMAVYELACHEKPGYQLQPGTRPEVLTIHGENKGNFGMSAQAWTDFLEVAGLFGRFSDNGYHITPFDSRMIFSWSRMRVIKQFEDSYRLSFIDFLEAIARVADLLSWPTSHELNRLGHRNITDYCTAVETNSLMPLLRRQSAYMIALPTRPLHEKLNCLFKRIKGRVYDNYLRMTEEEVKKMFKYEGWENVEPVLENLRLVD